MTLINLDEEMVDMFGEGGAEEVKEAYALPNPEKIVITPGVLELRELDPKGCGDYMFAISLHNAVKKQFNLEPDICTGGGNDKNFFSFTFRGTKLFAAVNEVGGLTVMLPSEY